MSILAASIIEIKFPNADHSASHVMKVYGKCPDSDENSDENSDEIIMHLYQAIMGTARGEIFLKLSKKLVWT